MKLSYKLAGLVGVPLLGLFVLLGMNIKRDLGLRWDFEIMRANVKVFDVAALLIDGLQSERRTLLVSGDRSVLRTQITKTDQIYKAFQNVVLDKSIDSSVQKLASDVAERFDKLRKIKAERFDESTADAYVALISELRSVQRSAYQGKAIDGIGKTFASLLLIQSFHANASRLHVEVYQVIARNKAIDQATAQELVQYESEIHGRMTSPVFVLTSEGLALLMRIQGSRDHAEFDIALQEIVARTKSGKFSTDKAYYDEIASRLNHQYFELMTMEVRHAYEKVAELQREASRRLWSSLYGGLSIIVLAFLAAYAFSRRITQPLHRTIQFAEEIGQGNLLHRLQLRRRDEIGQLGRALDAMAQKLARSADIKNEFVSMVSHELRTPLTSIQGSLGLLATGMSGAISKEAQAMLDIALRNTERLVRLINDILDIEKMEAGKVEFRYAAHDLKGLIEHAIQSTSDFAKQFGVQFVLKECSADLRVNVDGDRLMQVLVNLLSNAAKFSPRGGKVEIEAVKLPEKIRVSVTDCGPGIPPEVRDKIFQKFSQVDASSTRKQTGTGLGLAICKFIVEKMGGRIDYDSVVNERTTFYFELPDIPQSSFSVSSQRSLRKSESILVCEDNRDVAVLLRMLLEKSGFSVDVAHSASEAREQLAKNKYQAMTLDLLLPDRDGLSFLQDLRRTASTRDLPVIVVSARADERKQELRGGMMGVVDWIGKPVDEPRLLAAARRAVRKTVKEKGIARILHVENDSELRGVVTTLLKDIGEVVAATSLTEAREIISKQEFDLILLDDKLSDGSGLDLIPALKSTVNHDVPVVLFSAYEVGIEESKAVSAALIKARTSNTELINTLKSCLNRYQD